MHGEPLRIWLAATADLPLIGGLFGSAWVALAFSWAGALFDLSIVPLLSWRKTRAPAYLVLVLFHVLTALLFHIGLFPWIMILSATLFFEPSWPRDLLRRWAGERGFALSVVTPGIAGEAAHFESAPTRRRVRAPPNRLTAAQRALSRQHALDRRGLRFAWKVMLIEKSASLEFKSSMTADATISSCPATT